ncbi:MAG: protein-glutamate O-methyltransferase CheR [Deltaproteobacteria bacterium]|nr:protein-glutamate O-methyltransferase CheR [Deltaproteobacteria bacterium]
MYIHSSFRNETNSRAEQGLPVLLDKLYGERGWDFRGYKKMTLLRRVSKRLHATGCSSLSEYLRLLENDPSEYSRLFSSITIKVSEFFREPEVFAAIAEILRGEFCGTPVRAWCCASACGEEAYSVAMLFSECLGMDALGKAKVFATDIDADALEQARRATYRIDSMLNVAPDMKDRYFIPKDGLYKVKYGIRNLVKFGTLDIVQSTPLSGMQLVLCRNLFIYFGKPLQEKVFQKLDYALKPGGLLALGKAEVLPQPYMHGYVPVGKGLNLFRKKG